MDNLSAVRIASPRSSFSQLESYARVFQASLDRSIGWKGESPYPFSSVDCRDSYNIDIVPGRKINVLHGDDPVMTLENQSDGSLLYVGKLFDGLDAEDSFSFGYLGKVVSPENIAAARSETYGGRMPVDCLFFTENSSYVFGCDGEAFQAAVREFFSERLKEESLSLHFLSAGEYREQRRDYLNRYARPGKEDFGFEDSVFWFDGRTLKSQSQVELPGGEFLSIGQRFGYMQKVCDLRGDMAVLRDEIQKAAGIGEHGSFHFKDAVYLSSVTSGDSFGLYTDYGRRCLYSIRPEADGATFWVRDEGDGRNVRLNGMSELKRWVKSVCLAPGNLQRMGEEFAAYSRSVEKANVIEKIRRQPRRSKGLDIF